MAGERTVLLLQDAEGHAYLVPWETIVACRLTEEESAALATQLDEDDVSGHSPQFFSGRLLTAGDLQQEQQYGSRGTFLPGQRYTAVRLQQGRVQLDADWKGG
jgi:hypothetical protein